MAPYFIRFIQTTSSEDGLEVECRHSKSTAGVAATFDLKSGDKISSEGPFEQSRISRAEGGYFHLSLDLVPTGATTIHFPVTFLNADNSVGYPGRDGKALLLLELDIR